MGKVELQETRLDDVRIPGVSVSDTQPKTGLDTAEQRAEQTLAVRRQKEREWAEEKKRRDLEAAAERQRQLEQERQERQRRQEEECQERERQRQLKAAEAQREKQRREQERMWDEAITKALDETEEREPWRELGYIPPEEKVKPAETNLNQNSGAVGTDLRRSFRTLEQEDSGGTGTPRPSAYDAAKNALDSQTAGSGSGGSGKTPNPVPGSVLFTPADSLESKEEHKPDTAAADSRMLRENRYAEENTASPGDRLKSLEKAIQLQKAKIQGLSDAYQYDNAEREQKTLDLLEKQYAAENKRDLDRFIAEWTEEIDRQRQEQREQEILDLYNLYVPLPQETVASQEEEGYTGNGAEDIAGDADDIVLGSDHYDRQIQKIADEKGSVEAFKQIMADVDSYGNQLDDFSSADSASFNMLVASLVEEIGSVNEEMHYFRNELNRSPETLEELIEFNQGKSEDQQWKLLDPIQAGYHMNGENGEYNVKFISPDGHFEAVYNKSGVLLTAENDPENMGTYNYFGPNHLAAHQKYDVNPYIEFGNTKDAPKGLIENAKSIQNITLFWANPNAIKTYFDILRRANPEVYQRTVEYYESKSY